MNFGIIVFLLILIIFIFISSKEKLKSERNIKPHPRMEKNVLIFQRFWTPEDARSHPDWLFVYGDNDLHSGKGGQAIIRDEPNAFGIPTKKKPNETEGAFYTDKEYDENCEKIDNAIYIIRNAMKKNYSVLVLPKNGIGTGYAQLNKKAPNTFEYLQQELKLLQDDIMKSKI